MNLVSILMPAYNAESYIEKAIQSVLAQSYPHFELLITDDASTDSTNRIIQKYKDKRITCFSNPQNKGYLMTWNSLIEKAKGDFITFQDADDYSAPNRIEVLVRKLNSDASLHVCGSNYTWITGNGTIIKTSRFCLRHDEILSRIPTSFDFVGSALMIRRSVYETIGAYNTFFNRIGGEDHYWFYLISEKFKVGNIADNLYYYRFNPMSVSGNISDNVNKLIVPDLLKYLIQQRRTTKTDDLESGNIEKLQQVMTSLAAPFKQSKVYFYSFIAKRRFYEGHKWQAIRYLSEAIMSSPLKLSLYRDLVYYLRHL